MGRKVAIYAGLVLSLTGCASMTQHTMGGILESWTGEPVEKVVAQWGAPIKTLTVDDVTMYQWTDAQHDGLLTMSTERNVEAPSGGIFLKGTCTRQLIVHAGVVQSGTFHGDNCCVAAVAGYCKSLKNPGRL